MWQWVAMLTLVPAGVTAQKDQGPSTNVQRAPARSRRHPLSKVDRFIAETHRLVAEKARRSPRPAADPAAAKKSVIVAPTARQRFERKWGSPFHWDRNALSLLPAGDLFQLRRNLAIQASQVDSEVQAHRKPLQADELFRVAAPGVVSITAIGKETLTGTGFNYFGRIATNFHVVAGASRILITTGDGTAVEVDGIAYSDRDHDLVLLNAKLPDSASTPELPAPHGFEHDTIGEPVYVIGNPLGLRATISTGIISGIRENDGLSREMQITAPISSGSSGSPVFNRYGDVIGVVESTVWNGQNLNFAIPIDYLSHISRQDPMPVEKWSVWSRDPLLEAFPASDAALAQSLGQAKRGSAWPLRSIRTLHLEIANLSDENGTWVKPKDVWDAFATTLRSETRGISLLADNEPGAPVNAASLSEPTVSLHVESIPLSRGYAALILVSVVRPSVPAKRFVVETIPELVDRSSFPTTVWEQHQLLTAPNAGFLLEQIRKVASNLAADLMVANPDQKP